MKTMRALLVVAALLPGACGQAYESVRTETVVPYGNQRTAGSGHAYVMTAMLPEKTLNLQPVTPRPALRALPPVAEEIFRRRQEK